MAVILIVEDDAASRRNVALFLRLAGYEVYETEDGEAALSLLARIEFDLVISDFNLPGRINGIDILHALKTIPRKIGAVLVTARGSEEIKGTANSLGAAYMEKPLHLGELERTVQQRGRRQA
jgi:DNA-binding response OmpR family regulator